MRKPWTPDHDAILLEQYPAGNNNDIAAQLGRTPAAIKNRARKLGLQRDQDVRKINIQRTKQEQSWWTEEADNILRQHYATNSTAKVGEMVGRSARDTKCRAHILGLRKDPAWKAQNHSKFKPGQTPWNKGQSYHAGGRSVHTQFKPGQKPHTHQPVGTEVWREGYLWRKISDTKQPRGMSRRNWRQVHQIIWEEANGPIPPDHMIVFRDKNPRQLVLENLECITREENARRNTVHRYPEEIKQLIRIKAVLTRKINQRSKQHEKQE